MVPSSLRKKLAKEKEDHEVEAHICLAVEDKEQPIGDAIQDNTTSSDPFEVTANAGSLQANAGKRMVTTQCSRSEQVIEWIFVPCIFGSGVHVHVDDSKKGRDDN